jgi:hypothetical protein
MNKRELSAAVAAFAVERERREYFPAAWFDRLSLDDAYRIQLALIARRGTRRVGWKVGLTTQAIQQQFGVHEPVFGCLLVDGRVASGHVFRADELIARVSRTNFASSWLATLHRVRHLPMSRQRSIESTPPLRLSRGAAILQVSWRWRLPTTRGKKRSFSAPPGIAPTCRNSVRFP